MSINWIRLSKVITDAAQRPSADKEEEPNDSR